MGRLSDSLNRDNSTTTSGGRLKQLYEKKGISVSPETVSKVQTTTPLRREPDTVKTGTRVDSPTGAVQSPKNSTLRTVAEINYDLSELRDPWMNKIQSAKDRSQDYSAGDAAAQAAREELSRLEKEYESVKPRVTALEAELEKAKAAEREALKAAGYRDASLLDLTVGSVKQGYLNSKYGQESFKKMTGKENEAEKYQEILAGDEFKFIPEGKFQEAVQGAMNLFGQQVKQWSDPRSLAMAGAAGGVAAAAGQAGPQVLLPEEVITVPGAMAAGFQAGSALSNLEIEAGFAYNEMLDNGISEDTARTVAMFVGAGNAALELVQMDELAKAFKVLKKSGATKGAAQKLAKEILDRGLDVGKETLQEVAQEAVTIAGAQIASKKETGEWAYKTPEVKERLEDTAMSSALSFGMMNVPATVHNVTVNTARQYAADNLTGQELKRTNENFDKLESALNYQEGSQTRQQAEAIARDMEQSGNALTAVSDARWGKLARTMQEELETYGPKDGQTREAAVQAMHPDEKVMSPTAQSFIDAGDDAATADAKSAIMDRILAGDTTLKDTELRKLDLRSRATQEAFTALTGIEVPKTTDTKTLLQTFRSGIDAAADIIRKQSALDAAADAEVAAAEQKAAALAAEFEAKAKSAARTVPTPEELAARSFRPAGQENAQAAEQSTAQESRKGPDIGQVFKPADQTKSQTADSVETGGTVLLDDGRRLTREQFVASYLAEHPGASQSTAEAKYTDAVRLNGMGMEYPAAPSAKTQTEKKGKKRSVSAQTTEKAESRDTVEARTENTAEVGTDTTQVKKAAESAAGAKTEVSRKAPTRTQKLAAKAAAQALRGTGIKSVEIGFEGFGENENAFYDRETGRIVLNGDRMTTAREVMTVLGHELVHPSANTDTELVRAILDFGDTLLGKEAMDARLEQTLDTYLRFLMEQKGYTEEQARAEVTVDYAKEELAADLMAGVFGSTDAMYQLAKNNATVLQKARDAAARLVTRLAAGRTQEAGAMRTEAEWLVERMDRALRGVERRDTMDNNKEVRHSVERDEGSGARDAGSTETLGRKSETVRGVRGSDPGEQRDIQEGRGGAESSQSETRIERLTARAVNPEPGSGAHYVCAHTPEYGVTAYAIPGDVLSQEGHSTGFSTKGRVFVPAGLDAELGENFTRHELTHTMKQNEFYPYTEFIASLEERLNPGAVLDSIYAQMIAHRKLTGTFEDLDLSDQFDVLDEFCATTYGMYSMRPEAFSGVLGTAYKDINSFISEMDGLMEQYKSWNTSSDKRYSVSGESEWTDRIGKRQRPQREPVDWYGNWQTDAEIDKIRRNKNFKAFQSGVHDAFLDRNGRPLRFFHGTDQAGFHEFRPTGDFNDPGIWLTTDPHTAETYTVKGETSKDAQVYGEFVPFNAKTWEEAVERLPEQFPDFELRYDPEEESYQLLAPDGEIINEYWDTDKELVRFNEDYAITVRDYDGNANDTGRQIYQLFMSAKKPLIIDAKGAMWDELTTDMMADETLREAAQAKLDEKIKEALRRKKSRAAAMPDWSGGMLKSLAMELDPRERSLWTRDFVDLAMESAEEAGYDSVIFYNVQDGKPTPGDEALVGDILRKYNNFGFGSVKNALLRLEVMEDMFLENAASMGATEEELRILRDGSLYPYASDVYVALDPAQVKSVYNTGTWGQTGSRDIRYSVSSSQPFAEQVSRALAESAEENRHNALYIRETPYILSEVGLGDLPMCMTAKHVKDVNHPKGENYHWHGISEGLIAQLPDLLSKPVVVMDSDTKKGDVLVVTSAVDQDGNPVIVSIHPNGNARVDGEYGPANFITSMYGKDKDFTGWLEKNAKNGKVLYWNKERAQKLFHPGRLQLPAGRTSLDSTGTQKPFRGARLQLPAALTDLSSDTILRQHDGYVKENIPERRFSVGKKSGNVKTGGNTGNVNPETGYEAGSVADSFVRILNTGDRKGALDMLEQVAQQLAEAEAQRAEQRKQQAVQNAFRPKLTEDAITRNRRIIAELIDRYGEMEQTSAAQREVHIPKQIDDDTKVRGFIQTAEAAQATTEDVRNALEADILNGTAGTTYTPVTDNAALREARESFKDKKNFDKARAEWTAIVESGKMPTKFDIAKAEALYVQACAEGQVIEAQKLAAEIAAVGTQSGQVVQAMTLVKRMTPAGQLYYLQKAVDRLNAEKAQKDRNIKLKIDPALAKQLLDATNKAELDAALDALTQSLADQMPVTIADKWNTWRYLSMLGNPRTHIRNILGNAVFVPARLIKDVAAMGLEQGAVKAGLMTEDQRTKGIAGKALRDFAKQDSLLMEDELRGGGKYDPKDLIRDKRRVFKTGALNWAEKLNSSALEKEDWWFLQAAYVDALSGFLAARGLTAEQVSGANSTKEGRAALDQGRVYAVLEAKKATYRDASKLAQWLNHSARNSGTVGSILWGGLLPFTKTPVNIVKRGLEYSPVGLLNGLKNAATKLRSGDMTAAQVIDELAAGLTGTGIAALGYVLARMGLLVGGQGDDDEDQFEKLQGYQEYSLNVGGQSYTIDWAAPTVLPLFVGEALHRLEQENANGDLDGWDWLEASMGLLDPVMSLSMLDGLNRTLSAVRYDTGEPIPAILQTIVGSYVSQGIPTVLGAVARTVDDSRRTSFTPKGQTSVQRWLSRLWQTSFVGKIPVASEGRMAYVDEWGRTDTESSALLRAIENFVSPGYINPLKETPLEDELSRLAKATGDNGVYPNKAQKYFSVDGEDYIMDQEEYQEHLIYRGQKSYKLVGDITNSVTYAGLDDHTRAKAVELAYDYAAAMAKVNTSEAYAPDKWMLKLAEFEERGGDAAEYLMLRARAKISDRSLTEQIIQDPDISPVDAAEVLVMERTTPASFTDPYIKGYEYRMNEDQQARYAQVYREQFIPAYLELTQDDDYREATPAERKKMISDLGTEVNDRVKEDMADWLDEHGVESVEKE